MDEEAAATSSKPVKPPKKNKEPLAKRRCVQETTSSASTLVGKPDSADYFKIPEKFRTAENYEMIEETPFLQNSVNDTIVRGTVLQGESNFRQYNRVKKDAITKFALMHGIGAAEDLSRLTRELF